MATGSRNEPNWDPTEHYKDPDVARNYDATRFSSLPAKIYLSLERYFLLKALRNVPSGSTVADVACGTGRLAEVMLDAGYRVVGIDIASEMLSVAQRRLARFGDKFVIKVLDARKLTKSDMRVNAVVCARVLMHFPLNQQREFLTGITNITDGPVILIHSFNSRYQRFRRKIKRVLGHQQPVRYPISRSEINMLLQEAGLHGIARFHLFSMISEAIIIVSCKRKYIAA